MSMITRAYYATKLLVSANAPTILVAGGVVAMGAGAVLACKQTLKIEEVLGKHTPDLEKISQGESLELEGYGEDAILADRMRVYGRAGWDLTKLYAVPIAVFASGVALVFSGHRILLKRNAALALAFTGLKRIFDRYRANVVDEFGSMADQAMYSGHIVKQVVDGETGEKETIHVRDWENSDHDPYNRVFDEVNSSQWQDDLGINRIFISNMQRFANEKLGRQGYIYLCDVYKSLGFDDSDVSRVVGWKVQKFPDGTRDIPFVDFGLDKPHPDDWKYSKENAIYLDFNCQGLIVGGKIQKILEKS